METMPATVLSQAMIEAAPAAGRIPIATVKCATTVCANVVAFRGVPIARKQRRVLERIALAVMGSDREGLNPESFAPTSSNQLTYQVNLGVENGEVVWSDPERITTDGVDAEQVVWLENPGAAEERRVVWANIARPFLEGEFANGVDDNNNGLVDESGLSFDIDGSKVAIRLTLSQPGSEGQELVRTVETEATCRN